MHALTQNRQAQLRAHWARACPPRGGFPHDHGYGRGQGNKSDEPAWQTPSLESMLDMQKRPKRVGWEESTRGRRMPHAVKERVFPCDDWDGRSPVSEL